MIMFGSRVDVYLPEGVVPRVRNGERVRAGVSVLGEVA
jgi:phosphatidylserine decarboxylase